MKIPYSMLSMLGFSLVRREAILLNILHIRMLIKANTVILFEPFGSAESSLHQTFVKHLCVSLCLHRRHSRKANQMAFAYCRRT